MRLPAAPNQEPLGEVAARTGEVLTLYMRLTKFEHATLRLDHLGQALIIDPGVFTSPLHDLSDVTAVIITHEHPDHWTPAHLDALRQAAPGVTIYAPSGVAAAAPGYDIAVVAPGDTVTAGAFTLKFFGGQHAIIHSSVPMVENVGVLVNDELYYPGDSYAVPEGVQVSTLAAPLGAPWLKVGDAMDFVLEVAPKRAFGTHDVPLSEIGRTMHQQRLQWATEQGSGQYFDLRAGDSIDL